MQEICMCSVVVSSHGLQLVCSTCGFLCSLNRCDVRSGKREKDDRLNMFLFSFPVAAYLLVVKVLLRFRDYL